MSLNINAALNIAEKASAPHYRNGADLEDILLAALMAVGPWIGAQTLRDAADRAEYESPEGSASPYWLRACADEMDGI